jgi:signal transduction histidine kinase
MVGGLIPSMEILADPMLPKVFLNLLENSIRYADESATIKVHIEHQGMDLLIIYEDQGPGVPANEKEKIFEKGFGKGSGLGLFLIREILEITGIEIKENGEPGKGARFELRVPSGRFKIVG